MADDAVKVVGIGQLRVDQFDPIAAADKGTIRFHGLVNDVREWNARGKVAAEIAILADRGLKLRAEFVVVTDGETFDRASIARLHAVAELTDTRIVEVLDADHPGQVFLCRFAEVLGESIADVLAGLDEICPVAVGDELMPAVCVDHDCRAVQRQAGLSVGRQESMRRLFRFAPGSADLSLLETDFDATVIEALDHDAHINLSVGSTGGRPDGAQRCRADHHAQEKQDY